MTATVPHPNENRYNAGILVVNLEKWKEQNISDELIEYAENNQKIIQWPSQDPLNAVTSGQWLELAVEYNFYHGFINSDDEIYKNITPSIIHYSGSSKPWDYCSSHPYKKLYWQYLNKTPYRNYVPADKNAVNVIKSFLPRKIKTKLSSRLRHKSVKHS